MFRGLLGEAVQSIHACGEDIDILESFTYLGSVVWSITMVGQVKKCYGGLAWPCPAWPKVLWTHSARVFGIVSTCADG